MNIVVRGRARRGMKCDPDAVLIECGDGGPSLRRSRRVLVTSQSLGTRVWKTGTHDHVNRLQGVRYGFHPCSLILVHTVSFSL